VNPVINQGFSDIKLEAGGVGRAPPPALAELIVEKDRPWANRAEIITITERRSTKIELAPLAELGARQKLSAAAILPIV
jgi:hypothetical protein